MEKSQAKYKARHEKHQVDHQFEVGDQVWLHINKHRMKGEYLPTYVQMYPVVSVKNLNLYEPPMIMDEDESIQVPTVDYFTSKYLDKLHEDVIFNRRIRTSQRGDVEYLRVGPKGVKPSKAKWMEIRRVRELYPHLVVE